MAWRRSGVRLPMAPPSVPFVMMKETIGVGFPPPRYFAHQRYLAAPASANSQPIRKAGPDCLCEPDTDINRNKAHLRLYKVFISSITHPNFFIFEESTFPKKALCFNGSQFGFAQELINLFLGWLVSMDERPS